MSLLSGSSYIANQPQASNTTPFSVQNRLTGEDLPGEFFPAEPRQIESACTLAHHAFRPYAQLPVDRRIKFLNAIAEELESARGDIVPRAMAETGLPEARLNGELGRTIGQFKLFAGMLAEGSWVDSRIDLAEPERAPLPKPDLRSMMRPLGPVAVFGASNFPLAYSVAGGDTASALAAGCPVVVKAHEAHPGTSELVAQAIIRAVIATEMPAGTFALLFGDGPGVGQALVQHPAITAVGFTGSRRGGLTILATAQARPVPIPVYAEMSSINPSVILPGRLVQDPGALGKSFAGSITMGVGQFCTNPGLILLVEAPGADEFAQGLVDALSVATPATMLSEGIAQNYVSGLSGLSNQPGVTTLVAATVAGAPALFEVSATDFLENPELQSEVFGPSSLIVKCASVEEVITALEKLEGQLTGSIHASAEDETIVNDVLWAVEQRVGRVIWNQFPTGVEVCQAMVHGGPYPSTTDSRTTSVGGRAMDRWVRPVCYQNLPSAMLPPELK